MYKRASCSHFRSRSWQSIQYPDLLKPL
jgi:hypothetical protein